MTIVTDYEPETEEGCPTCGQPVIGMGPWGTLLECHPEPDCLLCRDSMLLGNLPCECARIGA